MKNNIICIIAGPCSVDENNTNELYRIAEIKILKPDKSVQRAIWGLRVVGLKSRSSIDMTGKGMGIDFAAYMKNVDTSVVTHNLDHSIVLPSMQIGKEISAKTGLTIATEIMDPSLQLPIYEKVFPNGGLFIWNPAVNQLGWQMLIMGIYARRNNWHIGIKNGKWFGDPQQNINVMEKNWIGQVSFACMDDVNFKSKVTIIQRGVDVSGKGDYRNLPVHDSTERVKKATAVKAFFDPSHTHGPILRDKIVSETIKAMKLMTSEGNYLYSGILIEVGTSQTDADQHISIEELEVLCQALANFREIQAPEKYENYTE